MKDADDTERAHKNHAEVIEGFEERIRGYYGELEAMVSTTVERKE